MPKLGNKPRKLSKDFAENEKMEFTKKKFKEMLIDFRKDRTIIPAIKIYLCVLGRVSFYELPELWIDDDLKWKNKR